MRRLFELLFFMVLLTISTAFAQQVPAPEQVTVSKGKEAGTINVSWAPVPDAMGYTIQYSPNEGQLWLDAGRTTAQEFTVRGLKAGKTYQFRVGARIGSASGKWSTPVSGQPTDVAGNAPHGLIIDVRPAAANSAAEMVLSWQAVEGAKSYLVQISTAAGAPAGEGFEELVTTNEARCVVRNLAKGKKYYFRVAAMTASGKSSWSVIEGKEVF